MENTQVPSELADQLRQIYASDPSHADELIADRLAEQWAELSEQEALRQLDGLIAMFASSASTAGRPEGEDDIEVSVLSRIFPLLLGERIDEGEVRSEQQLHRLAESLNIVFDALNELVEVIRTSLYGTDGVGQDTIRHVIGGRVKGDGDATSLAGYIDQIKRAFRDSQAAFQEASHAMVKEILTELDPERISEEGGGRRFGPFQKAESFKVYESKFRKCRKWFETGRFAEELLREFERNCHKLSQNQGG